MTPRNAIAQLKMTNSYGTDQFYTEAVDFLEKLIPGPPVAGTDRVLIAVSTGFSDDEQLVAECVAIPDDKDAAWAWSCVGAGDDIGRAIVEVDVPRFPTVVGRVVEGE